MTDANSDPAPRPKRRRRGLLTDLLIVLLIFIGVQWYKSRPLASGDAPPLRGQLIGAEPFDLAQWRGQPVLVHFWATWCPVCKLEEATIDALSRDYAVITVALQSGSAAQVDAYLREQGRRFPVITDPYGEIATAWGVRGVPASFVLDGNGRIRFAAAGYDPGIALRGKLWAAARL